MIKHYLIASIAHMIEDGYSYRDITNKYNVSNGTVTKIKKLCSDSNLKADDLDKMECDKLQNLFNPIRKSFTKTRALPDFEGIYERVTASQARSNLSVEWENYIQVYPDGYQYTQFCYHFNQWLKNHVGVSNVTMAINRVPAEYVYIDWVGDKISVVMDPETGEMKAAHFFVTTIGVSSLIYVQAFPHEKESSVIEGINAALRSYGGLPRYLRPDNMKTAVIKNDKNGLKLNAVMEDLQDFYNTPVIPARPLRPKDKGSVESACKLVEERVMSQLKGMTFESFQELNAEVHKYVEKLNNKITKRTGKSRYQIFCEVDKPELRPLPDGYFNPCEYKVCTILKNYHIKIGNQYYSVPYEFYTKGNQKVIAKISWSKITICNENNQFICSHDITYGNGRSTYHTISSHRPENHSEAARQMEASVDKYKLWAADIGPNTSQLISRILDGNKCPEHYFKTCDAILHKAKTDRKIVELAAKSVMEKGTTSLRFFNKTFNELKKKGVPIDHSNIRGGENYR